MKKNQLSLKRANQSFHIPHIHKPGVVTYTKYTKVLLVDLLQAIMLRDHTYGKA